MPWEKETVRELGSDISGIDTLVPVVEPLGMVVVAGIYSSEDLETVPDRLIFNFLVILAKLSGGRLTIPHQTTHDNYFPPHSLLSPFQP